MPIERVFLGWDGACLPRAVKWLRHRYAAGDRWDLANVLIATPGARAGRRLLELLIEEANRSERLTVLPPRIITSGDLAHHLYEASGPIADPLVCLLTRLRVIREASADVLRGIMVEPPDSDDLHECLALAQDLQRLHETLAADAVRIETVSAACQQLADFTEDDRWAALTQLQKAYECVLAEHGFQDPHLARLDAIETSRCRCEMDVILLAAADLNRTTRDMLKKLDAAVTALVHAPPDEAQNFDELGGLIVDRWCERRLDLAPSIVHVVNRPQDQVFAVLRAIENATGGHRRGRDDSPTSVPSADDFTIGLGDPEDSPMLERALDLAGLPVRSPITTTVGRSRPATGLELLASFVNRQRFSDLAALLRHPDLEAFLQHELDDAPDHRNGDHHRHADASHDWLTLLDRYATDHLPRHLQDHWLDERQTVSSLRALCDTLNSLLPSPAETRPLTHWSQAIAGALRRVYAQHILRRHDPADSQLIHALEAIGQALREQAQLDPHSDLAPEVGAADAIHLTLSRIAYQPIPPHSAAPAIEMLGWLELQLDDAPILIVTSVNEGRIPQSVNHDAFLPDGARHVLGLADNDRRYARDLMALTAMVHSRPHITLVASRQDRDGEPLAPSRLLLACDDASLTVRVNAFYREDHDDRTGSVLLLAPGENGFNIPAPEPPHEPIQKLNVTAFRDYLACPYRFYLKHVRRLEHLDDRAVEMDGATFGTLAHEVLAGFGRSNASTSTDLQAVTDFLSRRLDERMRRHFGANPSAALLVQREQLRRRLAGFARWQTEHAQQGWRIMSQHVETAHEAVIEVDGEPFTITGRIDRIDEHPEQGHYVFDYKTADTPRKPEAIHRHGPAGSKRWIDLQLPLYRRLAGSAGVVGKLVLGYLLLPKDMTKLSFEPAPWSETDLDEAEGQARCVIRAIRQGHFWPPAEPPSYEDGLESICMDACLERASAITTTDRLMNADRGAG